MSGEHRNQSNCTICSSRILNKNESSNQNKCGECLKKMDSVPSGFPFKMVNGVKECECPICLALIENATELTCTHLMCKACLDYYEQNEIEKHKDKAKFHCSVCQLEYQQNKKKLVKSMDRVIQTSLVVKCLQKECNWTGCIKDYEDHKKDCQYILIDCRHANCEVKVQRQLMDIHVVKCPLRPIQCEYCEEVVVFQLLKKHHDQCFNFPVVCPNEECSEELKRCEINTHCETECNFQQINCPYFEVGCFFQGIRGKIHQHCETAKFNHEILLMKTVKTLKEKNEHSEKNSREKDVEIKKLKEFNAKKDETLDELKRNLDDLRNQLKNVREQLTTEMEKKDEKTKNCFKVMIENQTKKNDQLNIEIADLQTFADRSSKLHLTLSDKQLLTNDHYACSLLPEKYDQYNEVKRWQDLIQEMEEDNSRCRYLRRLRESINRYSETIYSSTFEERFDNLCQMLSPGAFQGPFLKIVCSNITKHFCVKVFHKFNDFKTEIEKNSDKKTCKIQTHPDVCSYYVDRCLYVMLWLYMPPNGMYLLRKTNQQIYLPNGGIVDNMWWLGGTEDSIVLYKR